MLACPRLHLMLEWLGIVQDNINGSGRSVRTFKPFYPLGSRTAIVNEEDLQIVDGPRGAHRS